MTDEISETLEHLKRLETSSDIREAAINLSRQYEGLVLLELKPTKDSLQVEEIDSILFSPWHMQDRWDNSSRDNTHAKFTHEIDYRGLRITNLILLTAENTRDTPLLTAQNFAEQTGYEKSDEWDTFYYIGRFVKKS